MTRPITQASALAALLLSGAIFGFFYAWVCSTMWGLDATDPRIAIQAMQAMNASVRNAAFAPAFFGTAPILALTALLSIRDRNRQAATLFAAAMLIYATGAFAVTITVNIPLNEALAATQVPQDIGTAQAIWRDYSPRWQIFNQIRTVVSGLTLLLTGLGLVSLAKRP
jgi:uncharacterized membrane protein